MTTQRLMLVDDEPHVLAALRRELRELPNVEIACATDARDALRQMEGVPFDVVISDYRMPAMDGAAFLAQVRERQPQAVRMLLTATCDVRLMLDAVNRIEVFRYLVKPWLGDELRGQARLALAKARESRDERAHADAMRALSGTIGPDELERRRLEALEPGITHVEWGPNGEVLMPDLSTG